MNAFVFHFYNKFLQKNFSPTIYIQKRIDDQSKCEFFTLKKKIILMSLLFLKSYIRNSIIEKYTISKKNTLKQNEICFRVLKSFKLISIAKKLLFCFT